MLQHEAASANTPLSICNRQIKCDNLASKKNSYKPTAINAARQCSALSNYVNRHRTFQIINSGGERICETGIHLISAQGTSNFARTWQ